MGQTGSGKTVCAEILAKALTQLYDDGEKNEFYQPTKLYRLNPKSVTMHELYGSFNECKWLHTKLKHIIKYKECVCLCFVCFFNKTLLFCL